LLQRKKLCQSTIFFANGTAIACLPLQPDVEIRSRTRPPPRVCNAHCILPQLPFFLVLGWIADLEASGNRRRQPASEPPVQTSRKGTGLGANKRRAGPKGAHRHPPSGGPVSGAVVVSSVILRTDVGSRCCWIYSIQPHVCAFLFSLARARHPPSGGLVSGAVVGSFARGTCGASGAYLQCPNHPGGWGEPAGATRKAPRSPSQQPRKTTSAS
jgi:hypothetical protein